MRLFISSAIAFWLLLPRTFAEPPSISHFAPMAIYPGLTNAILIHGNHLSGVTSAWMSGKNSSIKVISSKSDEARVELWADANTESVLGFYIAGTNGLSDLQLIAVDPLPVSNSSTSRVQLPTAVEEVIRESTSNLWEFAAVRGERIAIEIVANRIGSMLDPVVRLLSPAGKELVYGTDVPSVTADSAFEYTIQEAGTYKVEVRDVGYRGGPKDLYHLRLFNKMSGFRFLGAQTVTTDYPEEQEPNDAPASANQIDVPGQITGGFSKPGDVDYFLFNAAKDQRLVFSGRTRVIGSPCDLALTILDTNLQKIASSTPAPDVDGALTNTFKSTGNYFLRVQELAGRGGQNCFYELNVHPFMPGFHLAQTNRIELNTNGSAEIKVIAQRFDYDGPITISIVPQTSGILLENETIPAKKNETTLKLKLATAHDGEMFPIELQGSGKQNDTNLTTRATIGTSLHKQFPLLLYPPRSLEHPIICFVK